MSKQGSILRGKIWYEKRDRDGNMPKGITDDPNKMLDVNNYLESIKEKEVKEISKKELKKSKEY